MEWDQPYHIDKDNRHVLRHTAVLFSSISDPSEVTFRCPHGKSPVSRWASMKVSIGKNNHSVVMDDLVNLFSSGQQPIGFLGIPLNEWLRDPPYMAMAKSWWPSSEKMSEDCRSHKLNFPVPPDFLHGAGAEAKDCWIWWDGNMWPEDRHPKRKSIGDLTNQNGTII